MYGFLNRTLCDVLDEMRKCDKTKNYAPMLSLIEEAQVFGNRMESALSDVKDIKELYKKRKKLKEEVKKLEEQKEVNF